MKVTLAGKELSIGLIEAVTFINDNQRIAMQSSDVVVEYVRKSNRIFITKIKSVIFRTDKKSQQAAREYIAHLYNELAEEILKKGK